MSKGLASILYHWGPRCSMELSCSGLRWTGVSPAAPGIVFFRPYTTVRLQIIDDRGTSYQLLKDAIIQLYLRAATLEQTMVIILQTLPVGIELLEAVGVDILDPTEISHAHKHQEQQERESYTLAAQRVTFLPSFKHSSSPRPLASALHFM